MASQADELTVVEKAEEKFFEIDLNGWNYKAFKAFRRAVQEDNEEVFIPLLAKVIKVWPFEGEPSADALDELGMADMAVTMSAVNQAVEKTFRAG